MGNTRKLLFINQEEYEWTQYLRYFLTVGVVIHRSARIPKYCLFIVLYCNITFLQHILVLVHLHSSLFSVFVIKLFFFFFIFRYEDQFVDETEFWRDVVLDQKVLCYDQLSEHLFNFFIWLHAFCNITPEVADKCILQLPSAMKMSF